MNNTKVIVCGDSFMTADARYPGEHFSEVLIDTYGYEVLNLARGGMSNVGICFQLEQAIKLNPHMILYNTTDANRTAFPIDRFDPNKGLKNIRYTDSVSASCGNSFVGDESSPVIDDVLISLNDDTCWTTLGKKKKYNLTEDQKTAIKYYTIYLHNEQFNEILQSWMLNYWKFEARSRLIPIFHVFNEIYHIWRHPEFLKGDRVFHTGPLLQKELAKEVDMLIKNI